MAVVHDRLTSLDASFLYLEESTTPMHVGSVMVFDPPQEGFDYDNLLRLVSNRIAFVPRYRQRIMQTPGWLANPIWVDDDSFDITYHVRRSALPKPGSREQLEEFVGRVQSRPLDRTRPLWELYLVEGLRGGRFAIVTKTHEVVVDGISAVDLGQVILDVDPVGEEEPAPPWHPQPPPSVVDVTMELVLSSLRTPGRMLSETVEALSDIRSVGRRVAAATGGVLEVAGRIASRRGPDSPLVASIGAYRRFVMVETQLADYQKVRTAFAGAENEHVTVHDVVLATIAGGLRTWLLTRGQGVTTGETVRAMVPVSIQDGQSAAEQVAACFVDLPVGEPRPRMRLHQVAYAMQQQTDVRAAVGARSLSALSGFAPPTLHSLGARLGSAMSRRMFELVVTNVPGPQQLLYADDVPMVSSYPVIPLAKGQALTIGLTSYHGLVCFGINADRDAMPDVEILGQCLQEALAELLSDTKGRR